MAQAKKAARPNVFVRFSKYIKESRIELKRVVWPNKDEIINSSIVVVMTLAFFVLFTFVVDQLSGWLFLDLLAGIGR